MRWLLRLALAGLVPAFPFACSTEAVGVEECREIEQARCEAGRSCDLGIDSDADFETCERFARDNCLHGLAVKGTPSSSELNGCVDAIERAGACAASSKNLASTCDIDTYEPSSTVPVCDIVQDPEKAEACEFLVEEPPEDVPDPPSGDAGGD